MKSSGWSRCSVPSTSALTIDSGSARLRQRFEVARDVGQAGAVDRVRGVLQHADAARDVAFEFAHARLDDVVGVAERLEAFVLGPFEEGGHFLAGRALLRRLRRPRRSGGRPWRPRRGAPRRRRAPPSAGARPARPVRRRRGLQPAGTARTIPAARRLRRRRPPGRSHRGAPRSTAFITPVATTLLLAQRHDDRIDQVRHVVVQDQQGGRHAAAAVRVAQLRDLAAVRRAARGLEEAVPQHRRQAVRATCLRGLRRPATPSQAPIRASTWLLSAAGLLALTSASVCVRRSCGMCFILLLQCLLCSASRCAPACGRARRDR